VPLPRPERAGERPIVPRRVSEAKLVPGATSLTRRATYRLAYASGYHRTLMTRMCKFKRNAWGDDIIAPAMLSG
jgi:hypothetical protein